MTKKCPVRTLADWALSELANTIVTTVGHALNNNIVVSVGAAAAAAAADIDYNDNDDDDGDPEHPMAATTTLHFSQRPDDVAVAVIIVTVQQHLEDGGATAYVYQDLLRLILGSDHLEATVRFTCLQALLNGSVQALVSEIFPFSFYEKILQVIAAQGAGLRSLNLRGVWVKEEHMSYMYEIVRNCRQLRQLSIPYIATDELLEQIAKWSEALRVLDISGETDITDIGIERMCGAASRDWLRIVDIGTLGEENICHSDIAQLIVHLPQLASLVSYSYVGQALVYVQDNVDAGFTTRLRYLHDTRTSERTMEAIVRMCPLLESLYLDTPERGVVARVADFAQPVQRLKLHKFCCREFAELTERAGGALLHVTLVKGRGALDLGRLARWCGGLVDLDLYMMDGLLYVGERPFPGLCGLEMLSSPLSNAALRHLVGLAPRLQRLAVDQVGFSDEDMASILLEHELPYLEDVWFTSAPNLTVSTVELLMDRCPALQSIGQLSGWSLTPDDVVLLRGLLKSANSALIMPARRQELCAPSDAMYWM